MSRLHIFLLLAAVGGAFVAAQEFAPEIRQFITSYTREATPPKEVEAVKYTCPMHPQIISDNPGICPICGMTLVPLKSEHNHIATDKPELAFEAGMIQKMGVRTEKAARTGGALTIPTSAILRDSEGNHVIVALGEGRFRGREVRIGATYKGRTRILSGLKEGEQVVTRAQFMIDSESNLREALNKFEGNRHAGH